MIYLNKTTAVQVVVIPRNGGRLPYHKPDYIVDAPKDGKTYGRKDGHWVENAGGDAYTKVESDARYARKSTTYTKTEITNLLINKQDKLIPGSGISIAADGKTISASGGGSVDAYTKAESDARFASKSTTYTKTEVDAQLATKAAVGASYTKAEEDAKLAGKANSSDVYTKAEMQGELARKADDTEVVHKAGEETITGQKTFSRGIKTGVVYIPTTNDGVTMAASEVDEDNGKVSIVGDAGSFTFEVERDPITNMEVATKGYADRIASGKMSWCGLVCDGEKITKEGETTALTFLQIKALVDDPTQFVALKYGDIFWLLPQYDDLGGAIVFTGVSLLSEQGDVWRVAINEQNEISDYSIAIENQYLKTNDLTKETIGSFETYPTTIAVNAKLGQLEERIDQVEEFVVKASRDGNTRTCDKTYAEIVAAFNAGKSVRMDFAMMSNGVVSWHADFSIARLESSGVTFCATLNVTTYAFTVRADGIIQFTSYQMADSADVGTKSNLTTTDKSNLVAAINEVNTTKADKADTYTKAEVDALVEGGGGGGNDERMLPIREDGVYLVDDNFNIGKRLDYNPLERYVFGHWCSLGTSITAQNTTLAGIEKGYQTRVMEVVHFAEFTNMGVNGSKVSDLANNLALIPTADVYTIEYGINDWGGAATLGTADDYLNNTGTSTFFGSYRKVIDQIYTLNVDAKIILITPRKARYGTDSTESAVGGVKLSAFAEAVCSIGQIEALPICDWFAESQVNNHTITKYSIDNLHPNDEGMQIMAEILCREFIKISNS